MSDERYKVWVQIEHHPGDENEEPENVGEEVDVREFDTLGEAEAFVSRIEALD